MLKNWTLLLLAENKGTFPIFLTPTKFLDNENKCLLKKGINVILLFNSKEFEISKYICFIHQVPVFEHFPDEPELHGTINERGHNLGLVSHEYFLSRSIRTNVNDRLCTFSAFCACHFRKIKSEVGETGLLLIYRNLRIQSISTKKVEVL